MTFDVTKFSNTMGRVSVYIDNAIYGIFRYDFQRYTDLIYHCQPMSTIGHHCQLYHSPYNMYSWIFIGLWREEENFDHILRDYITSFKSNSSPTLNHFQSRSILSTSVGPTIHAVTGLLTAASGWHTSQINVSLNPTNCDYACYASQWSMIWVHFKPNDFD